MSGEPIEHYTSYPPEEDESHEAERNQEQDEDDMIQTTVDKYSNELNDALLSSDVLSVRRLCQLPAIRSYSPYHLTQLEMVLSSGRITGQAQEQCWQALSDAWPESVEGNLDVLLRAAVSGGPLRALESIIQRIRQRSPSQPAFLATLKLEEDYVQGDERKGLFHAEKQKAW